MHVESDSMVIKMVRVDVTLLVRSTRFLCISSTVVIMDSSLLLIDDDDDDDDDDDECRLLSGPPSDCWAVRRRSDDDIIFSQLPNFLLYCFSIVDALASFWYLINGGLIEWIDNGASINT